MDTSACFYGSNWHNFPGDYGQEVGPDGMGINEWKDVQGSISPPDVVIIITEIINMDVGCDSNIPCFVELHAPRKKREIVVGDSIMI